LSTSAGFSGSTIHHRHGLAILLLAVTLTGLMGFSEAAFSTSNLFLRVHFLDVGQGDSALILFPNGAAMLIDGGERSEGPRVAGYLESLGLTSLDVVVATHPHSDHIGGLITVLERFKVGLVVDSGQINPTKTFEDYLNTIDRRNIPFKIGRGGRPPGIGSKRPGEHHLAPRLPLQGDGIRLGRQQPCPEDSL
jgi:beta-lactamase superfamily II metal-dependent hydrolase